MKLDLFLNRRKPLSKQPKDDIERLMVVIEKFAPRDHTEQRDLYYYNYRIMELYRRPLLALLTILSQKEDFDRDQTLFGSELFVKLKNFYDPNNKLTLSQAMDDLSLVRKFQEIFVLFYGRKGMGMKEIRQYLADAS